MLCRCSGNPTAGRSRPPSPLPGSGSRQGRVRGERSSPREPRGVCRPRQRRPAPGRCGAHAPSRPPRPPPHFGPGTASPAGTSPLGASTAPAARPGPLSGVGSPSRAGRAGGAPVPRLGADPASSAGVGAAGAAQTPVCSHRLLGVREWVGLQHRSLEWPGRARGEATGGHRAAPGCADPVFQPCLFPCPSSPLSRGQSAPPAACSPSQGTWALGPSSGSPDELCLSPQGGGSWGHYSWPRTCIILVKLGCCAEGNARFVGAARHTTRRDPQVPAEDLLPGWREPGSLWVLCTSCSNSHTKYISSLYVRCWRCPFACGLLVLLFASLKSCLPSWKGEN